MLAEMDNEGQENEGRLPGVPGKRMLSGVWRKGKGRGQDEKQSTLSERENGR
jgi:hypothetical protein